MLEFHTFDVFTKAPYSGNPLAIVLNADDLTSAQMQTIAREFNLSETIFVQTPDDPSHTAKVRIFTPTAELSFAGHPTVGCAIFLAEQKHDSSDFEEKITLEEVAGLVPVSVASGNGVSHAEFVAPVVPHAHPNELPNDEIIAEALGLNLEDIGFGSHKSEIWQGGPAFIFVPVTDRSALSTARANGEAWLKLTKTADCDSVYVYTDNGANDFTARMFAPENGIPEDPATGSASAIFAAQLHAAGALTEGSNFFTLKQGVDMGRPSDISLSVEVSDQEISEVRISGSAVRLSSGKLASLPLASNK